MDRTATASLDAVAVRFRRIEFVHWQSARWAGRRVAVGVVTGWAIDVTGVAIGWAGVAGRRATPPEAPRPATRRLRPSTVTLPATSGQDRGSDGLQVPQHRLHVGLAGREELGDGVLPWAVGVAPG